MIVPWQSLDPDTLQNLLEEFVSRDGTDYGEQELSLAQKADQIRLKLISGEALLLFSESTGQCNIVPRERLPEFDH
ncbi:YheU family protein [Marinobacterium sp. MBR-109]|jgi:uncharacterized protein YheU (UPF0270 family)|uniref:YheU family protein n=1 Tax=Marinobacterium sp. MBR-109 TaxID=3156462 RepID=UPI00339A356C